MSNEPRVVLLVDDDVLVRNLARRNLEAAGFRVLAAADAAEALTMSRACPDNIDAAVVDVELPDVDGVTVAEEILRERSEIAILLMSGGTSRVIPEHMSFIAKPFLHCELAATLDEVLANHRNRMRVDETEGDQSLVSERSSRS